MPAARLRDRRGNRHIRNGKKKAFGNGVRSTGKGISKYRNFQAAANAHQRQLGDMVGDANYPYADLCMLISDL